MGNRGYDYGRKYRTTSNQRRADWWSVWPWLIAATLVTALVVYLTIRH